MKLKKYMKLMEAEPQEEMTEHELELYNSLLEIGRASCRERV